jgi:hypothetical protein
MNTLTYQELSDLYQKAADGGEFEVSMPIAGTNEREWAPTKDSPSTASHRLNWRIKPTKKVIDLAVLIDSQIDCEFDNRGNTSSIAKLETIIPSRDDGAFVYINDKGLYWDRCQPRMNHKHAWQGGECPIEGFVVRAWIDKEDFLTVLTSSNSIDWSKIMYVEFLETEHDYVMPWEVSDE